MALRPAEWTVLTSAVGAVATALKGGEAGRRHFITGYSISGSAAPAAAVSAQVRNQGGANIMDQIEIPAAVFPPIVQDYVSPLECPLSGNADITLPSLGGATRGTVELRGYTL